MGAGTKWEGNGRRPAGPISKYRPRKRARMARGCKKGKKDDYLYQKSFRERGKRGRKKRVPNKQPISLSLAKKDRSDELPKQKKGKRGGG